MDWTIESKNITLDNATKIISANLRTASRSFVAIGFYLKVVRDNKSYESAGYKDINEFAKDKFNMSVSSVSRYIAINDKFSQDGNSPVLSDQYKDFGVGQLQEMLPLSEEIRDKVTPDMTVKQIREMNPKKEKPLATSQIERVHGEVVEEPPKQSIDDLDLSVRTFNILSKAGIETVEDLTKLSDDDLSNMRGMSNRQIAEIRKKLDKPKSKQCAHDDSFTCNHTEVQKIAKVDGIECPVACCWGCPDRRLCGYACNPSRKHPKEEVKQEEASEQVTTYTLDDVKSKLFAAKLNCEMMAKEEHPPMKAYLSEQMKADAFKLLLDQMNKPKVPEVIQPELPILKNNDQRKEFIDNYKSWPLWIDQQLTGEKFYRYDFDNGESIVIKASLHHPWGSNNGKYGYKEEAEYGREEYYLIRTDVDGYGPKNPTFMECRTNMSALVDYLKELQKGVK